MSKLEQALAGYDTGMDVGNPELPRYLVDIMRETRLPDNINMTDEEKSRFRKWLTKLMVRQDYAPYNEEGQYTPSNLNLAKLLEIYNARQ
jgi:hypothetical protein